MAEVTLKTNDAVTEDKRGPVCMECRQATGVKLIAALGAGRP